MTTHYTGGTGGTGAGRSSLGPRTSNAGSIHRPSTASRHSSIAESARSGRGWDQDSGDSGSTQAQARDERDMGALEKKWKDYKWSEDDELSKLLVTTGSYCVQNGEPTKLIVDATLSKLTYITIDQEKMLHAAAQTKIPCNIAWRDCTIFLVDIVSTDDIKRGDANVRSRAHKWKTVSITFKSFVVDDKVVTVNFIFNNLEEAIKWEAGLKLLREQSANVYFNNPARIQMRKLWLWADSSGDGGVSSEEIPNLLDKINCKKSIAALKSILTKIVDDIKEEKKGLIGGLVKKIKGPTLPKVELNNKQFEQFIFHLENHDTCDGLWAQYCTTPRMGEKFLSRFLELEQKEPKRDPTGNPPDPRCYQEQCKEIFKYFATTGKTSISKKSFEGYVKRSRLNIAGDLHSETHLDKYTEPMIDYFVNTASECLTYGDCMGKYNDDEEESPLPVDAAQAEAAREKQQEKQKEKALKALEYHLKAGVRCLHLEGIDLDKTKKEFFVKVSRDLSIPIQKVFESIKANSHRPGISYPLILRLDLLFCDPKIEAQFAGVLRDQRFLGLDCLLGKKKLPWEIIPSLDYDPPPKDEDDKKKKPIKFTPATMSDFIGNVPSQTSKTSSQTTPANIMIMLGPRQKSEGELNENNLAEMNEFSNQWCTELIKLCHFQCVRPEFQEKSTSLVDVRQTLIKYAKPLCNERPKLQQTKRDYAKKDPGLYQSQVITVAENSLLPVVILKEREFRDTCQREEVEKEKKQREAARKAQVAKAGEGQEPTAEAEFDNPDDDPNKMVLGQDPVEPMSMRDLTRQLFVFTDLPPLHNQLGMDIALTPESYHTVSCCWEHGVQFVALRHNQYVFDVEEERSSVKASSHAYKFPTAPFRFDNSWLCNLTFFKNNNNNGWIRKPWNLRTLWRKEQERLIDAEAVPKGKSKPLYVKRPVGSCTYMVRIISGMSLPEVQGVEEAAAIRDFFVSLVSRELNMTVPDPFVDVKLDGTALDHAANVKQFIVPGTSAYHRTKEVPDNGFCPVFDERFSFRIQKKEFAFLTFNIYDCKEEKGHVFLCQACIHVASSRPGFRCLFLYDRCGMPMTTCPTLLVHIDECRDGDSEEIARYIDKLDEQKKLLAKKLADLKEGANREKEAYKKRAKKATQVLNDLEEERKRLDKLENRICHSGLLASMCVIQ